MPLALNFPMVMWVDTHTHLYLNEFDEDRVAVIRESIEMGVTKMYLPNIDENSILPLLNTVNQFPENCFPMVGLHPGSVDKNFESKLSIIEALLPKEKFYGIGEIGIDLYWDKTFKTEQMTAFEIQLNWAKKNHLPVIIHIRDAFDEVFSVIEKVNSPDLFGIFHCFTGTYEQAIHAIDLGFLLGIGGIVTFKKSSLPEILQKIPLSHIVLETDSPYLTPVPYRGKRNKSAYIPLIGRKVAEVTGRSVQEVAEITTANALKVFGVK